MVRSLPAASARDEGGIVLGWLTKVAVTLAIAGVVLFDVVSVVAAKMSVEDQGAQAALSASDTWDRTHDVKAALATAEQSASEANPGNVVDVSSFRIDSDGTAHVTVSRVAPTLVAHYVSPLRKLCDVSAASTGRSSA